MAESKMPCIALKKSAIRHPLSIVRHPSLDLLLIIVD
jgi:hypothetical protein